MAAKQPTEDKTPVEMDDDQRPAADVDAASIADAVATACEEGESGLEGELAAEKDRVLRLQAEMENLRSRTAREIVDERRYGALSLLRDLLPALDNIERAIEAAEQNDDTAGLLEGFKLVKQQLTTIFEQHHCQQIDALGQPFDPQIHEAILQQPSDEQPASHVLQVTQVGYLLHDRVVRPAQVIISSGPAPEEDA
ncbi:MAG: nucleotide exchange factor GrpE [Planctomycetes bacterium]|nr:nucleotide exchange factor GrpE [Planctomycetota bacterium]